MFSSCPRTPKLDRDVFQVLDRQIKSVNCDGSAVASGMEQELLGFEGEDEDAFFGYR